MPNKVLRKLLVAFLVVLIPIQGFAALSMGFCGDLEKGADGMAHAHAASTPAMNHGQLSAGDSDDLADDFDSELAHCAACAACGVSAGIAQSPTASRGLRASCQMGCTDRL
ncbi:MAG: hypothetical protein ACWGNS_12080 [Burkholderiales bacterium]